MFKKSLILVLSFVGIVAASAFTTQMVLSAQLPSAYDPGIGIEEAFQTSKTPLLIEFYSDTCSTCRVVTPKLHELYNRKYKEKLTLVMLNVESGDVFQVSQLFGVSAIPAVYVFDAKQMKKTVIPPETLMTEALVAQKIDEALAVSQKAVESGAPPKGPFARMGQAG